MKSNKSFFLTLLFCSIYSKNYEDEIKLINSVNFDKAMSFDDQQEFITKRVNIDFFKRLDVFKKIFENNKVSKIESLELKIPKIIHQIWLGSEMPDEFKIFAEKCKKIHSDWKYILWNDKNIKQLFPLNNQKYFDESQNFGEKSDILRYEILYRFGGLYIDSDYECIKSFEVLSYMYDFYGGIEPLNKSGLIIGNALIGAKEKHPILKECIKSIKDFRKKKTIPERTGPAHLTRCVLKLLKNNDHSLMIFPSSFIYPIKIDENSFDIKDETLGIHYWYGTWLKK